MPYQFKCSGVGFDCPFTAEGDTEEEVIEKAKKHGKEAHGFSDEQLNDPEMVAKVKKAIEKK
jgi:predicted small metal-binding protein